MLLRVENVIKSYPDTEVPVLRGISFGLDRGDMLALTGESGSGKSTLLHLTGGLDIADSGEVIVESGETISDERMYQAGLLQIVTKMRSEKRRSFEELFVEIRDKLRLHPQGFRAYVNTNMNTVMATVKKTGTSRG